MFKQGQLLEKIQFPSDLKKLDEIQLIQISNELRQYIIDVVCNNPGHFGASLGVVELTVALHYVFNTPDDLLIWDVGHQAYGHKILTGRKDLFNSNRKLNGISGFPKPSESIYDAFGVGHSSTSISAALGMAMALKLQKVKKQVIAVIGDGSMTAGMAFEAMNHAGMLKPDMLVILNDNNMAIDANVGALKEYLVDITTSQTYNKVKDEVWKMLGKISRFGPNAQVFAQKIENGVKSIILRQSNLFESLNFRYFGPVDGHDVVNLSKILKDLKGIPGPKLLHVITKKGKGYKFAELDQTKWHAPGTFDKNTGEIISLNGHSCSGTKYQDVFGHTIVELAEKNPKIVGITPAMASGCSLNIMMEKMPQRAFDVGIAEQHAVTYSAGLAKQGMIPFCNIYSSFMQRAFDQVIHDVAIQNLNVVFCLDRGGLVGEDGATHHGVFDLAYMRIIPNMIVSSPMDEEELRNLMYSAQLQDKGPYTIRYPRGNGVMADWRKPFKEIETGKGRLLRNGKDIAILSIGHIGNTVVKVCNKLEENENISIAHYDMRFVKPLDEKLLHSIFKNFQNIITVEDGVLKGGFGSAILEFMSDNGYNSNVKRLGIPDKFIEHGTVHQLHNECGIDSEGIYNATLQQIIKPVASFVK
ncbi:MAG: 1-deoxy-D-xylulose-5-phosphate synthase [Bacteroidetes bacterium GWA2_30_7]|nr:MAG: 1-deoxy-D-xylulose-5-phosphate synthase [Bacteroidetes bacterium GWA2_30_7]